MGGGKSSSRTSSNSSQDQIDARATSSASDGAFSVGRIGDIGGDLTNSYSTVETDHESVAAAFGFAEGVATEGAALIGNTLKTVEGLTAANTSALQALANPDGEGAQNTQTTLIAVAGIVAAAYIFSGK